MAVNGQKRDLEIIFRRKKKTKSHTSNAALAGTDLRMARDTFCFQGLSLRMPMPKPERKNSSPVVTRSHFCEASNSSTAESQMKACSLLWGRGRQEEEEGKEGVTVQQYNDLHTHLRLPPPLALLHTRSCHSAFTSNVYRFLRPK